jgi:hypothetical protein
MSKLVYIKIVFLVVALGMIIYLISNLSADKVNQGLAAIGAAPGTADAPGLQPYTREVRAGEERFNLCRTRVHAVIWPDGKKVEEKKQGLKLTWEAHDPEARELPYLGVEKWFSRHCQIVVAMEAGSGAGSSVGDFKNYLTLVYVDGSRDSIDRNSAGFFRIGSKDFRSDDLEAAVAELQGIAQFQH